jgi:hypothetical protein
MNNYDVAQFLIENGNELKQVIQPVAEECYKLKPFFTGMITDVFTEHYQALVCELLAKELASSFPDITYEELRCNITPELIIELNGEDFFDYD